MKKFPTAIAAAVLMLFSVAVLAACGHEHTYSDKWSVSETEHWYAATCEHTDEVKDKGSHEFSGQSVCSVCGYVKPNEHKVTKQQWETALDFPHTNFSLTVKKAAYDSVINVGDGAYSVQFDFVTLFMSFGDDGVWLYMPLEMMGGMSVEESDGEDVRELTFIKVNIDSLGGNLPVEGLIGDYDEFCAMVKNQIEGVAAGARNGFDDAVFDEEKNAYILTGVDYTFMDESEGELTYVYGANYEIAFSGGKMTSLKETFFNDANHSESEKVVAEISDIDETVIILPETVESTVTKEQYEAAFDNSIIDNMSLSCNFGSSGDTPLYMSCEFDGAKFYQITPEGEYYTEYVDSDEYCYNYYNDSGTWHRTKAYFEQDESLPKSPEANIAQFKTLLIDSFFAFARDKFDSALWLGDMCVIMTDKVDNILNPYDGSKISIYNVIYSFSFEDGKFSAMSVSGSSDLSGQDSIGAAVKIGGIDITLPSVGSGSTDFKNPYVIDVLLSMMPDNFTVNMVVGEEMNSPTEKTLVVGDGKGGMLDDTYYHFNGDRVYSYVSDGTGSFTREDVTDREGTPRDFDDFVSAVKEKYIMNLFRGGIAYASESYEGDGEESGYKWCVDVSGANKFTDPMGGKEVAYEYAEYVILFGEGNAVTEMQVCFYGDSEGKNEVASFYVYDVGSTAVNLPQSAE